MIALRAQRHISPGLLRYVRELEIERASEPPVITIAFSETTWKQLAMGLLRLTERREIRRDPERAAFLERILEAMRAKGAM